LHGRNDSSLGYTARDPLVAKALHKLLGEPFDARICRNRTRRNLIVVQAESQELHALGEFNPEFPKMSPFLSELARNGTVFMNFDNQPYTGWSSGSLYAAHCGLPQIAGNVISFRGVRRSRKRIGRVLRKAGVQLFTIWTPGLRYPMLKKTGWKVDSVHEETHDMPLTRYINATIFPELELLNEKGTPFVLFWGTEGVHGGVPFIDPSLPNRNGRRRTRCSGGSTRRNK
jgi:hypothetical protein